MGLPRDFPGEHIKFISCARNRQHSSILCDAQRRLYGSYLRNGQRLLSRRRAQYRSYPRSRRRGDSGSIVGAVSIQQFGKFGGECRGARRPGEGRHGKRDPSPLAAIKVDYEVTKASMTEDGSLPDDVLKDEVATRAELTKVAAADRPNFSALFDYSITRRNYAQLKAAGWQPIR
jgi:hypothetical protein